MSTPRWGRGDQIADRNSGDANSISALTSMPCSSLLPNTETSWLITPTFISEITSSVATAGAPPDRSEEHTSELQSLMRTSYAVFCLKKKNIHTHIINNLKEQKQAQQTTTTQS